MVWHRLNHDCCGGACALRSCSGGYEARVCALLSSVSGGFLRFPPVLFRVCALDTQARVSCPTQYPQSESKNNHFTEMRCGNKEGSYLSLIDSCITQLKAQRPSRTCNESEEEEESEESRPEQALKEELAGLECFQSTKVHPHNLFSQPVRPASSQPVLELRNLRCCGTSLGGKQCRMNRAGQPVQPRAKQGWARV